MRRLASLCGLSLLLALAGCGTPDGTKPAVIAIASGLSGSVPASVARVEVLSASGRTTSASVANGQFTVALPAESWSLVFRGANGNAIANLVAPTSGTGTRKTGVFPAKRVASSTHPLEGQTRDALLQGDVLVLGTITIQVTVAIAASNPLADLDSDGDGVVDLSDDDDDGDGTADSNEPVSILDLDGDGLIASVDGDDDGDGRLDGVDPDDDNDGTPDVSERDTDGDGLPDAVDTDDDGDGVPDGSDPHDVTPDLLIGVWNGTTEVTDFEFAPERAVMLQERFELKADGVMLGHFQGTDAVSGCDIDYQLRGTWADADDAVDRLEVQWTSVSATISTCTNPEFDHEGEVDPEERDLWDDELDGVWWYSNDTLDIDLGDGNVIEYDRGA